MARYLNEAAAQADGFVFNHEPDQRQFTVTRDGHVFGVAHYTLFGDADGGGTRTIDFDHTEVDPELRGTGISAILAARALSDDIVIDRSMKTSCWFMDGYLTKHPELLKR